MTLRWDIPDPLNGIFAAYELRYGEERDFAGTLRESLLFATQFTVSGLRGGVLYRLEVRASTRSLIGDTLWGPFAILGVRDGKGFSVSETRAVAIAS